MKKNILFLCQYFYPEAVSSAILPTQLAESLVKEGYNVNVICGNSQDYFNDKKQNRIGLYNGISIQRLNYGKFNNKNKLGRIVNFFSFFIAVVLRFLKIIKNDVIIIYTNPPILPFVGYLTKIFGKSKFIFVGFDLYPDNAIATNSINPNGMISKIMKFINRRVFSKVDSVIAISTEMKEYLIKTHVQLDVEKITVIPNWYTGEIEIDNEIADEEFKKLKENHKLIVLYTGNIGEAQDMDTIVNSIIDMNNSNKYKDVLFIFTGHGSRKDEIEQKLNNMGINNTLFYGFLKGQDYKDVLNIADICLVSLKKGIEGLGVPSKTYGYFAFGKPVISIMSNETELAKNITQYYAGFNVVQGDTENFICCISKFLNDENLIKKCGENSLKIHNELYAKEYSLEKYKDNIERLICTKKGE